MSDPQNWSIFPASQHLLPLGGSSDGSGAVAGSVGAAHFSSPVVFLSGDVAAIIGEFGSPVHSTTPSTRNAAQPRTNQRAAPPAASAGHSSGMQAKPASSMTAAPTATTSPASISGTLAPAVVTPSSSATTSSTANTAEPLTSSSPFIVTGTFPPSLVPVLYDNTAANPAGELVQTSNQSQGGNPMAAGGLSETGVRLADGTIQITGPDLSSGGFGNPWGQTRTWSNGAGYANTNIVGTGWVVDQLPYLQQNSAGNVIALISSSTNAYMFDNAGSGTITPRYFLQNNLTDNTTA